ncbi:protein kinase-like domain-containing protein [Xylariomycetidae sp. FL2044]|nr:protein kinase-like domain-containing protein [Xylariomycetidae sp. FL2044]
MAFGQKPEERVYLNSRFMGEQGNAYYDGGLHPVYLGDILGGRYQVFRKLRSGRLSTIWLARDKGASTRQYVAVRVFSAKNSEPVKQVVEGFPFLSQHGKKFVDVPIDAFTIHRPKGDYFCTVHEPPADSLYLLLQNARDQRWELNAPNEEQGRALEGDPWSVAFAKRACWQILQGLDYLHKHGIAHRALELSDVYFTQTLDLSSLSENDLVKPIWPAEQPTEAKENAQEPTMEVELSEDSSDSDEDEPTPQWVLDWEECKRRTAEQWEACERGDATAEPLSEEWNKANFYNSRAWIELLHRRDGKPQGPDEIRYTIAPLPLDSGFGLRKVRDPEHNRTSQLVLECLLSACRFDECGDRPGPLVFNGMAPEALMDLPSTHKSDIFSLGHFFWEVVMVRELVGGVAWDDDPGQHTRKSKQLQELVRRLGPLPRGLRAQWPEADKYLDAEGNALDVPEEDKDGYGGDPFPYEDILEQAQRRKPLDMLDKDMEVFVRLLRKMLQWQPELRPTTSEVIQDEWFKEVREEAEVVG